MPKYTFPPIFLGYFTPALPGCLKLHLKTVFIIVVGSVSYLVRGLTAEKN
jgi:hypothetical protein